MFQNILLGTDGSEAALQAARSAAALAQKFCGRVTVIHVLEMPSTNIAYMGVWDFAYCDDAILQNAEKIEKAATEAVGSILEAAGVPYTVRCERGHAADRILEAAREVDADAIVLGSRGLGGISSFLLGSVSDRVLHHAHCPVLIIR